MINDGGCYFWFIQISRNYEIPGWKIRRASMTVAVEHKYVCCTQFKCIFFALGNNLQTVSFVKQQTFSGLWKNLHKFLFERIFIPQQNINSCKAFQEIFETFSNFSGRFESSLLFAFISEFMFPLRKFYYIAKRLSEIETVAAST